MSETSLAAELKKSLQAGRESEARERAAEAWHQFLRHAVSENAEPHEVFAWAYMAGWAHDKWPAVRDIVPPPDVTRSRMAECGPLSACARRGHPRAVLQAPAGSPEVK